MNEVISANNALDLEQAWWIRSCSVLHRRSVALLLISLGCAALLTLTLWDRVSPALLLCWLGTLTGAAGGQTLLLHRADCPIHSGLTPSRRWLGAWLVLVLVQGALWGSITLLLLPTPTPAAVLLLAAVLLGTGICLAPLVHGYLLFLLAALLSVLVLTALGARAGGLTLIIGLLAPGLALLLWNLHAVLLDFRARLGNYRAQLEEELRYTRNRNREILLELQEMEDKAAELTSLTMQDALTQIANRRHFDNLLKQEWQRGMRNKQPLSLIMLDIDHFKLYNDSHGHQAGDQCLHQVARTLQQFIRRPSDLAARYGGEEFALILPETPGEAAFEMGQQLCTAIRHLKPAHRQQAKPSHENVTISAGVATLIPDEKYRPAQLIQMADEALYTAKSNGRDQACKAGEPQS